ncbi:MAG: hypothetical protein MSH08_02475 [Ezakiella sp.]|nr:hypothetical protein [Ezakiella sp.]MDD7472333.1 hypothetical protein [Bacillota bacterium]MDY3923070.1 hypothetical protein [Ezakiella sp.]
MAILILTAFFLSVNIEASIENKGLEVRVYNSYQEFINDTQTYNRSVEVGAILTAGVVRSYGSENCELYININGKYLYGSLKWEEIKLYDTSIFSGKVYYTNRDGFKYFPAGKIRSVKIDDFNLEEDIEKVKISVKIFLDII